MVDHQLTKLFDSVKMSQNSLFENSIEKLRFLFKYSGMNLDIKTNSIERIKYRIFYIFNFVFVMISVLCIFYYMHVLFDLGTDFVEVTSCAPCLIFTILGLFKSAIHYMNEDKVFKLLDNLRRLDAEAFKNEINNNKQIIYTREISFLNSVLKLLYFMNCSMMIVFDLIPLILVVWIYYNTNELAMMLPYMDIFVFIPSHYGIWIFAYIYQIWAEAVVLLVLGASDYLFFTCCTYINIQFRLLEVDFEELISIDEISSKYIRENFREKFTRLIKWHQDLIELTDLLETIYSKSNLFNFLTSSLVICLTMFNVTQSNDISLQITFLIFLFMGLMQVFFVCLFADLLTSASMDIGNAVYNSRWYLTDTNNMKDLLLVNTRSIKPCKITAFGFADVNLRAFTRVLSTSWSYFALLQTIYEK